MNHVRLLQCIALGVLLMAGCRDVVTPDHARVAPVLRDAAGELGDDTSVQGCVNDGECALDPLAVTAPPSPSDCATPGCPGYEGDGTRQTAEGGGGSGSSSSSSPPGTPRAHPGDDVPQDTTIPDCNRASQTPNTHDDAWCGGWVPTGEFLDRVTKALARMEARGTTCAELASKARLLLSRGTLRFTDVDYSGWVAAAPLGGNWAIFDRVWVDLWGTDGKSLDYILSHEMDHSLNHVVSEFTDVDGHLLNEDGSVNKWHTINSQRCAGL